MQVHKMHSPMSPGNPSVSIQDAPPRWKNHSTTLNDLETISFLSMLFSQESHMLPVLFDLIGLQAYYEGYEPEITYLTTSETRYRKLR